jgi:signal transduction histidine kinase
MEQEEVVRGAEIQLRRRDGVVIWVRDTVRVVRAADGQVLYYQGSLEDITEQKRVAEAEREQRALIEALRDTAEALNRSLDPAEVLEHILANVGRVVRHDAANIMLIEQGIARVAHCQGYEERGSTVAGLQVALIDVPGFRQMMETGQPLLIPDINAYPNWIDLQKSQWQPSYIGVPIRAVDEVIGFLNLDSATPGFFTSTHVKHLEAFADQVAVAVTNARLYEDRRRQAARAEALARAASRLNTHLELEAVLDAICDETVHALNVPAASVTLYDEQNQVFHHVATLGLPAEYRERARPFPRALYDKFAAAQGRVVVALDAQALPEVPNADLYASLDIRTIVGASMWHEEQLIGGLNIFTFGTVRHFNADELALLMGLADQAALAIAHARLYASLQETNVRLFDALQAKDAMIQNVSHELRTPLTIISGYAELLTEGLLGTLGTEQAEAVQLICQQSGRLYFMVNRLLTLQTLDTRALDKVELDLQIFLQQTVKAWQARASAAKVQLRLEISDGLINLRADADLMGQVVENLLDNAMKFSPSGGLISVRAWAEESRVVIAIADQGIGLSAEQRARVFERFYQVDSSTRRRFGGAGIGLALCKAIVEAHAGRIWVESAGVGQGSTFYVALPIEG